MPRIVEAFLDTSYAIALASSTDEFHSKAMIFARQMVFDNSRIITTHAVMLEIGNALSRLRYRSTAIELLGLFEQDPSCEIVTLSEQLYARAFQLYASRPDKEWGLVDCVSFIVMQDRKLSVALTTDIHFQQAGFQAILRV